MWSDRGVDRPGCRSENLYLATAEGVDRAQVVVSSPSHYLPCYWCCCICPPLLLLFLIVQCVSVGRRTFMSVCVYLHVVLVGLDARACVFVGGLGGVKRTRAR